MKTFSDKQLDFWRNANHRWNIKTGATRSGKTYMDYFIVPRRVRACTGSGLIVLLGNTKSTIERNLLEPMRNLYGRALVGEISASNALQLFGRRAWALGADKISQVYRLQGQGMEYCYGDEITTWHEDVFTMLKSRLDKPNSCFDGTCNPGNPNHWFKRFLDSGADIYQQAYTIDDNPFLEPAFVRNLKKEYTGTVYYDRFILGRWKKAEGLVYPGFEPERHVYRGAAPQGGRWFISVDYGTLNPFAAGLWCYSGGVAYLSKEYYYDGRRERRQLTDEEYYGELAALAGERNIEYVVVDPSASSFITCIYSHGRFAALKADNAVADGIRNTATALNGGRIQIHESCTNTIREFGEYSWDDKAAEDSPLKESDHAMDMVRYFAQTILLHEKKWGVPNGRSEQLYPPH